MKSHEVITLKNPKHQKLLLIPELTQRCTLGYHRRYYEYIYKTYIYMDLTIAKDIANLSLVLLFEQCVYSTSGSSLCIFVFFFFEMALAFTYFTKANNRNYYKTQV